MNKMRMCYKYLQEAFRLRSVWAKVVRILLGTLQHKAEHLWVGQGIHKVLKRTNKRLYIVLYLVPTVWVLIGEEGKFLFIAKRLCKKQFGTG